MFCQPLRVAAVSIHHPDFWIAARVGLREFVERDFLAIVRPDWAAGIAGADGSQALLATAVGIHHVEFASTDRRVENRTLSSCRRAKLKGRIRSRADR